MRKRQRKSRSARFEPISVDAGLWQCLSSMRQASMDALPVCEGDSLVGLVVEQDVLRALRVGADHGIRSLVRDVMQTQVFCCYEDENPKFVMNHMGENGIRHAFILNRLGGLIGMITLGKRATPHTGGDEAASAWLC